MNNCLKKIGLFLFVLLTVALFAAVFTGTAKASDQTINCISTGCSGLSGALFNETNIAPGNSVTRTLHVLNTDNPDSCNLTMSATIPEVRGRAGSGDFTTRLFTVIKDGLSDIYGVRDGADKATNFKTLGNLPSDTPISLGSIAAGASRDYNWTVYFDKDSGNNYQEASAKFDLNLTFVCGNPTEPTPTPGSVGGASAPTCDVAKPGLPTNFVVSNTGTGTVTLTWGVPPAPYTYFLVAYSDNSLSPKWGNPDVGNVTTYTVSGLGAGSYWFWLRAGNGCMPGDFVGPVSSGTITGIGGAGIATGFVQGVLGTQTQEEAKETISEVKGAASCQDKYYRWWMPLLIEAIIFIFYLYWLNKGKLMTRRWFVIPFVVAAASQIIHEILKCNCATGVWCPKYIYLNFLILTVFFAIYYFLNRSKKNGSKNP